MNNNPISTCVKSCPYGITVQDVRVVKSMANCVVHVQPINTTYYVDSQHQITILFSGPVYVDDYNFVANPLNLRGQTCYDFANDRAIHYNNQGEYRIIKLEKI